MNLNLSSEISELGTPGLVAPILCLVTDLGVVGHDSARLIEAVSDGVDGGVNMVQVRAPELGVGEFDALVDGIVDRVDGRSLIVVNPSGREIKLYEGVGGVQLSESSGGKIGEVRRLYGDRAVIGRSVHSEESGRDAWESGADFLVLGTVFPSETHPGGFVHGTETVRRVVKDVEIPLIGIGGITTRNVGHVVGNGAVGVAVIRSILAAKDPGAAARELIDAMVRDLKN